MNFKLCLYSTFFLLFNFCNAFNITTLLSQHPDFKTFNDYLTQTQLAGEINSRETITILAVENSALSPISGKSNDMLKKVLSVHVVLDYYDVSKLQKLSNKTAILTTLFQSTGQATGQQGFLNVTLLNTGSVVFGSAVKGETLGATLVKSIASQPFNISVLQISTPIIPMGIENSNSTTKTPPSPSPSASPAKSPSTAPPKSSLAPAPSHAKPIPPPAKAPKAPAPSADASKAPAPSTDASEAPSNATAPVPAAGSPPKPADIPTAAGAPAADAPNGDSPSAGACFGLSLAVVMMMIVSSTLFLM